MGVSIVPQTLAPVVSTASAPIQNTDQLIGSIRDPLGVYCVLEVCDRTYDKYGQPTDSNPFYHVFPVAPESLTIAQQYLQTVTPTAGGVFVDDYGEAPSPVVLQGTFGRFPQGFNIPFGTGARLQGLPDNISDASKQGTPIASLLPSSVLTQDSISILTGYRLAKLMSDLVDRAHTPDGNGRPRVAKFYNFAFDRYYEVTLDRFEAQMSVQQNNLWIYTLQMTTLKPLTSFAAQVHLQETLARITNDAAAQSSSTVHSWTAHLPGWVQTAIAKVSTPATVARTGVTNVLKIVGTVDTTVNHTVRTITRLTPGSVIGYAATGLDRVLKLPDGTVGNFLFFATQIPDYVGAVANVVNHVTNQIPADTLQGIQNAKASLAAVQAAVHAATVLPAVAPLTLKVPSANVTPGGTNPVPQNNAAIVELAELALAAEHALNGIDVVVATNGLSLSGAPAVGSSSVVANATNGVTVGGNVPPASITIVLRQGDTLAGLATQYYGDPEQWPTLVDANPLVFSAASLPAPDADLSALMGETLVVPRQGKTTTTDPNVLDVPTGTAALGMDVSHTLTTTPRSDGTLDLTVLPPLDTLLESIWHRLSTPVGGVPDVPSFGSRVPLLLGETFGALDGPMATTRVAEALGQEPRLTNVSQVRVTMQNGEATVAFQASAANLGPIGTVATTLSTSN